VEEAIDVIRRVENGFERKSVPQANDQDMPNWLYSTNSILLFDRVTMRGTLGDYRVRGILLAHISRQAEMLSYASIGRKFHAAAAQVAA
jgi:hypothetical protein